MALLLSKILSSRDSNERGSVPNGYINEDDIRRVFQGVTFSVTSRRTGRPVASIPILTQGAVQGLWDYHFSDVSLADKLSDFNEKIEIFRNKLQSTGDLKKAYLAVLSEYPIGFSRFYDKATEFANRMMMASISGLPYQQRYPLSSLASLYHIYLTKLTFPLYKPLDAF